MLESTVWLYEAVDGGGGGRGGRGGRGGGSGDSEGGLEDEKVGVDDDDLPVVVVVVVLNVDDREDCTSTP